MICKRRYPVHGLTLVELLVAMTIFGVLLALTMSIVINVQSVQNKIDRKLNIDQELKTVTVKISTALKTMNKLIAAGPCRIQFIGHQGDSISYFIQRDTLWSNDHPITNLVADTIEFQYFQPDRTDAIDFYYADKNYDGLLTASELQGITAIRVILGFYDNQPGRKTLLRREVFTGIRNTLILSR